VSETLTLSAPAAPGYWAMLGEDLACVFERDPAARSRLEVLTTYPGLHALIAHRVAHRMWLSGWRFAARLLSFVGRLLSNVDIHPGACIGRRFFIDHGAGVVIGETAIVGDDVTLYHGVTLGGTSWNKGRRHPTLADGVVVGAGAKILGPISIGENVRVGANSVVVKDVPAGSTVIGVPGRIVASRPGGKRSDQDKGISLDHNLLPDPVAKSIACLIERIEALERALAAVRHQPSPPEHSGKCQTCSAGDLCCEHAAMH